MSTSTETREVILEAAGPGASTRRMFGEAALYLGPKVVALICDDRLFLKATAVGILTPLARRGLR